MASNLNDGNIRRSKRSNAGVNSKYNTPSPIRARKSAPPNSFKKNIVSSQKDKPVNCNSPINIKKGDKVDQFSKILEQVTNLESQLEKQISKTDILESEICALKLENEAQRRNFQCQLDNIKTFISGIMKKDNDSCNDFQAQLVSLKKDPFSITCKNRYSSLPLDVEEPSVLEQATPAACKVISANPTSTYSEIVSATQQVRSDNTQQNIASTTTNLTTNTIHDTNFCQNKFYPRQPIEKKKRRANQKGKNKLFIVGDSHIKRIERDIVKHHLHDKNTTLACKNFDGANVDRINHCLLPILHEDLPDSIIIHAGTNDISERKLNITRPYDLATKIVEIGKVSRLFGVEKIAISSILPQNNTDCQAIIDETNDFLKDLCGFNNFSFIDNANINNTFLHLDEIHLNKVGSFMLGKNFTNYFNDGFNYFNECF